MQIPNTDNLELFYASNYSLYTRWRNPDGSWSAEQMLVSYVDGALAPVAVVY
jgi:hypothetical protein